MSWVLFTLRWLSVGGIKYLEKVSCGLGDFHNFCVTKEYLKSKHCQKAWERPTPKMDLCLNMVRSRVLLTKS